MPSGMLTLAAAPGPTTRPTARPRAQRATPLPPARAPAARAVLCVIIRRKPCSFRCSALEECAFLRGSARQCCQLSCTLLHTALLSHP